ncbi:hypothetical protein LXL04_037925 [Taraxacum kok-saghyz]
MRQRQPSFADFLLHRRPATSATSATASPSPISPLFSTSKLRFHLFSTSKLRFHHLQAPISPVQHLQAPIPSPPSSDFITSNLDFALQTQTADVWSTSSAAEGCRCGPQTADVLASKKQTSPKCQIPTKRSTCVTNHL